MKQLRPYQINAVNDVFKELIKSDDPILLVASVGSGKSLIGGTICKRFQDLNKNVLCLVNSAELVRNNSLAFQELGGKPSIFCASLNLKQYKSNIVFATPQSIISAIKNDHPIATRAFNLIIVDEAHGISHKNDRSCFMRIFRHFKHAYRKMRLLGLTGTPYRLDNGGTESIIGDNALFKKSVGNITTQWLIENNYLVKPEFGITHVDSIDMSAYHVEKTTKNKQKALDKIVSKNKRLTWDILQEVQSIMKNRNGAFIFCSSIAHCYEAMSALPSDITRLIIGSTSDQERHQILTDARNKKIKYLVSVSCLLVGIDVPYFCATVFLRPTKSLTLFTQAIGRSLRLHPEKKDALVLDYAQNLKTFSDFDDPLINEAVKPTPENEKDYLFECPSCTTKNTLFARRCIGVINNKRCENYFEWKDCPSCFEKNDSVSRECRSCGQELIDPNAKLSLTPFNPDHMVVDVLEANYRVTGTQTSFYVTAGYKCKNGLYVYEHFTPSSEKAKNLFYGKFARQHVKDSSKYYPRLQNMDAVKQMLKEVITPQSLTVQPTDKGYTIKKKHFPQDTQE
jgi:DNA repair protein RadD